MHTFIALVFALTVHVDLRDPAHLYKMYGTMGPNGQFTTMLAVKKDLPIKVEIQGIGKGDIDCYLLMRNSATNGQGWVIAAKDESNLNQCSINFTPSSDTSFKLWVVNNSFQHSTDYSATVDQ